MDPLIESYGGQITDNKETIYSYFFKNENAISIKIDCSNYSSPIGYLFIGMIKEPHGCDAIDGFCIPINGNYFKPIIINKDKYIGILSEVVNDKKDFSFFIPTTYESHISLCTYFKKYPYGLDEEDISKLFKIGPKKYGILHHKYDYPKNIKNYTIKIEMI